MNTLIEYELNTGAISIAYSFPEGEDGPVRRQGYGYIEGLGHADKFYVLDGVLTERLTQSTTLDGRTLTGLPVPALLHIDGETYTVDDGEAELDFILPGTYRLRVEAWPFKDWEGEVTVPVLSGAEA
jgi:hypothetical protein